jgi:hypothetical protein
MDTELGGRVEAMLRRQSDLTPEVYDLLDRYERGERESILSVCVDRVEEGAYLPLHTLLAGRIMHEEGDSRALQMLFRGNEILAGPCLTHAADWPWGGGSFEDVAVLALHQPSGPDVFIILDTIRQLALLDSFLAARVVLAENDLQGGVDPFITASLRQLWDELGGPQAAAEQGIGTPWLEPGVLADIERELRLVAMADSTDAGMAVLGLKFYLRILSSFWWSTPRFNESQRDFLFARIDSCRAYLDSLAGPEEAMYMATRAMSQEAAATDRFLQDPLFAPHLERMRNRVATGEGLLSVLRQDPP